ncbi:cytidylyltransferase domain-containing protein [Fusobacterium varium]|uniref:Acylneuraminate cytidylyltransferase n=1 Tax=Fusobacterium varium ATCC 27725 TaxID=469618 RepID=A0ABN5JGF7_FUSVA|nr:glycosyltransferase family protein [Fusobacterium varium]AVQ29838.1 acylneuraminate cytidylyltransferase [Fusobacterium varium ATCC 27725]EES65131.1 cytidylyltransferase [Fusobacterium varium ATCC 27725]
MNIVCIIQARTTSSRLPNKVLLNLPYNGDKTVLEQVINRVKESKYINKIVVATTINETDNKIEKLCESLQISCFRGSEDNVLSRYYEAATKYKADLIIRITSDCPCIDYEIMDKLIEFHLNNNNDFSSNNQIHSFPHGLDCEIVNYNVLVEAFKNATEKYEKEHVMPYIYISNPNKYKLGILKDKNNNHDIRITLDTKEDYILLCLVYDFLYENDNFFNKDKIIKLFQEKSYLYEINKNIEQKKVCKDLIEEVEEAKKLLKKQDLNKAYNFLIENWEKK